MLLTEMKARRHRLTALFLDGEYAVSVDTETLQELGWKTGREVSAEELHMLLERSDIHRAKEKALYLLEHRSHSRKELEDKVARTVPREAAKAAVQKMEELGLLDDAAYAQQLARELYRKGYAKRRVCYELSCRGVDAQTAQAAALENEPEAAGQIDAILQKKYRDLSDEKIRRRAVAALQRMGYAFEDIRAALRRQTDEDGWNG